MRILFCGDVVGRPGRRALCEQLPALRRRLQPDLVIANGENAAAGFGITSKICAEFFSLGVDVVTGGNHIFDQRETLSLVAQEKRLLRPANFPAGCPGSGVWSGTRLSGGRVVVINLQGRLFMEDLDDPFAVADRLLARERLGQTCAAIVVDFHAEATSEKQALAHHLDGRVSLVVGTHTHVPTADAMILPGGTAYQSDSGMCGAYHSVIGMDAQEPVRRFREKTPGRRFEVAEGAASLCGVWVETRADGLAQVIQPVRVGGVVGESLPL